MGFSRNALRCRKTGTCRILVPLRYIVHPWYLELKVCFQSCNLFPGIPFDIAPNTQLLTLTAADPDGQSSLDVTYSLQAAVFVSKEGERIPALTFFSIDPTTGVITTIDEFGENFLDGYFDLVVLATDNNSGQSAVATVNVRIAQISEKLGLENFWLRKIN